MGTASNVCRWLLDNRKSLIFVLAPLLLLPLPILAEGKESKCAYVMIIMAVYWVAEVLPLGVTALIPVFAIPAFKIMPSRDLCPAYFKDSNMLFIGGLILAIGVEYWDLHKRIALRVLLLFGVEAKWLLLGFMLPTWFMSMWISNTATTAMMIPIVDAVLHELQKHAIRKKNQLRLVDKQPISNVDFKNNIELTSQTSKTEDSISIIPDDTEDKFEDDQKIESIHEFIAKEENKDFKNTCKMLTIAIAYSANYGGTATLTGTSPNLVLNNLIQTFFGAETGFNFGTWFLFAFPISLVCVLVCWIWLQLLFLGPKSFCNTGKLSKTEKEDIQSALRKEYKKLGSITFAEVTCIIVFFITVVLWITREPGGPGWGSLFTEKNAKGQTVYYMGDAQPAILMAIFLFILPSYRPFKHRHTVNIAEIKQTGDGEEEVIEKHVVEKKPETILNWTTAQKHLPWGIVLLLGGGFAIADAAQVSGLSLLIGRQLTVLKDIPTSALVILIALMSTLFTETTSNTATASIFLPILVNLSRCINLNPLALMITCTVACSFAFNLPVATPPNSIVFAKGYLTVPDMIKSGCVLTITSMLIVSAATLTYGGHIFNLWEYPSWAGACANSTSGSFDLSAQYQNLMPVQSLIP